MNRATTRAVEPEVSRAEAPAPHAHGALLGAGESTYVVQNGQLRVVYQPVVQLTTDAVVGAEAVVRWEHPRLGALQPVQSLALAESSDRAPDIANWVLYEACSALEALRDRHPLCQTVSVDLSEHQVLDPSLPERINQVLESTSTPATGLVLRVSGRGLDLDAASRCLTALHDVGVRLALDDYGIGHAGLLLLRDLPLALVKIDRTFTRGLTSNPANRAIVRSTLALAASLGIECVAEDLDTPAQASALTRMGCALGQGEMWAGPLPLSQLDGWLAERLVASSASTSVPETAPAHLTLPELLDMRRNGASTLTLAAILNSRGQRTRDGVRWTGARVSHVLRGRESLI
ncbi:MAG: EAL domain-containing protein [Mycobacteriales bacterium]|nr:EAL domain-containing protein [Mycobacteriales bacterium]